MKITGLILKAFLLLFTVSAFTKEEAVSWQDLLEEKNKDYPGCVFIVRNEIQYLDEYQLDYSVPMLLHSCIKGREIGEKRMKNMYDIDPKKDKPLKEEFEIRLSPMNEKQDERSIFYK